MTRSSVILAHASRGDTSCSKRSSISSSRSRMPERSTDGHDGGFDLILGCPNEPAIDASRRLNCITNSVQVDGCQHGVDKSTEAPAPGSFNVVALDSLDLNGRA